MFTKQCYNWLPKDCIIRETEGKTYVCLKDKTESIQLMKPAKNQHLRIHTHISIGYGAMSLSLSDAWASGVITLAFPEPVLETLNLFLSGIMIFGSTEELENLCNRHNLCLTNENRALIRQMSCGISKEQYVLINEQYIRNTVSGIVKDEPSISFMDTYHEILARSILTGCIMLINHCCNVIGDTDKKIDTNGQPIWTHTKQSYQDAIAGYPLCSNDTAQGILIHYLSSAAQPGSWKWKVPPHEAFLHINQILRELPAVQPGQLESACNQALIKKRKNTKQAP